jgi:hypothetical protein
LQLRAPDALHRHAFVQAGTLHSQLANSRGHVPLAAFERLYDVFALGAFARLMHCRPREPATPPAALGIFRPHPPI